jgi:hypothetical protein
VFEEEIHHTITSNKMFKEGEKIAMKDMTNDLLKVVSIFTSLLL